MIFNFVIVTFKIIKLLNTINGFNYLKNVSNAYVWAKQLLTSVCLMEGKGVNPFDYSVIKIAFN